MDVTYETTSFDQSNYPTQIFGIQISRNQIAKFSTTKKVPCLSTKKMSSTSTPSKKLSADTSYLDCSWSIHERGWLYVRLSPKVAEGLGLKKQVHINLLGKIQTVSFTKRFQQEQVKQHSVLKLHVDTSVGEESQDVDAETKIWYAFQENRFTDLAEDNSAKKGKFFGKPWVTNSAALNAYQEAAVNKKLGSNGNWLRGVLKTDLAETQDPTVSESSAEAASRMAPAAFTFKVAGASNDKSKQASKIPDEEAAVNELFGTESGEEDEMGFASQRFEQEQTAAKGAHFDFVCLCWLFVCVCIYVIMWLLCV